MEKRYDRYECNVKFRVNENSAYVFDNLEEKELWLSDSIDDKVNGFIRFVYNHARDYKNPLGNLFMNGWE